MLYAGLISKLNGGREIEWHVGQKIDGHKYTDPEGFTCLVIQADGDELEWVHRYISNIPIAYVPHSHVMDVGGQDPARMLAPIQKWKGEFAQFIFDHLPRSWDVRT